ncbi:MULTISPECIES: hypothetical protein [unclassified Kitasatospora]|uniref:hypothetical protein n=1 Tax=unclassified Kitasatospora TaxID=2633591 RepID=UPI0033C91D1B
MASIEYGLAVLQVAPWAIACVLLYRRSGAILPLMIAHVCYDLLATVTNRISARQGLAAALTVFTAVTAIEAVTAFRQGRYRCAAMPNRSSDRGRTATILLGREAGRYGIGPGGLLRRCP